MTTQATETVSTTSTIEDSNSNLDTFQGIIIGDQGFGGITRFGRVPKGLRGFLGDLYNIEVSSKYTENVNAILDIDSDVQDLISQGYNITSIKPVLKNIVEADGTLITRASTALVTLQNVTSGHATINVDVEQGEVTQIVIITKTVIDKTTT